VHAVEPRTEHQGRHQAAHQAAHQGQAQDQQGTDTVAEVVHSPGRPLDRGLRGSMESAFGTDLGDVRLHSGTGAERSAAALGARAYTVGEHVVLGRDAGPHTLVHELAHVVQQRGAPATGGPLPVSRPGDTGERAADAAAHQVSTGQRVTGLAGSGRRQVARQPTGQGQKVAPPQVQGKAHLDAHEAAQLVTGELFDTHGFFAAVREVLDGFRRDMTTQLGWYAGSKTEAAPESSMAGKVAKGAAEDVAKKVGKAALEVLIQGLSGATIAAGPAGVAADLLVGAISTVVGDLDSYRPVVVTEAQKPAHQVLIESIEKVVGHEQDELRQRWAAQTTDSERQLGAGGLQKYAEQIQKATEVVRSTFYLELVTAYLRLGTGGQTVELQTPHAQYTGEGRGFKVFQGPRYWVEKIAADEVYVEFKATGFTEADFRIVRTVVPRLPSTVLAELNASPDPRATLGNLPFRRLVMEADTPVGPVKLTWDPVTATLSAQDIPHFSKFFCLQVAKAAGVDQNYVTGTDMSSGEYVGAVHVYSWIITRPIGQLHFSA
jgi:hypothetical protein